MSCGNLFLQDPVNRFWILSASDDGTLVTSQTPTIPPNFTPPVITSPSFFWRLSSTVNGVITATSVGATAASSFYNLSSINGKVFSLTMQDNGVLLTTSSAGALAGILVPYPIDVTMSVFPNLGLTSSIAGSTPLTVSADYSIWSCTLNQFINEDTTNIIVVLSE